jgi:hypothetical protein
MRRIMHAVLLSLLFLGISLFFLRDLFFPEPKLFYPADFVVSDLIDVNFALKSYLAKCLADFRLPFITPDVGNGFAILAESQVGALNIFNLVLYFFLPTVWAFNLTYLLGFYFVLLGTYHLADYLYKNKALALFLAVSFGFSGCIYLKIVHQTLFQAISLIPLIFFLFLKAFKDKSKLSLAVLIFFSAQQFLYGQFFYSLATNLFLFVAWLYFFISRKNKRLLVDYLLYLVVTFLLVSPQFVQTVVYFLQSSRLAPSGENLYTNVFKPLYLLTFFWPFPFGTVTDGSFFRSLAWKQNKLIPWEANLFVGVIGFLTIFAVFYFIFKKDILKKRLKKSRYFNIFFILFSLSFLLMFGGHTPLRLFLTLPVINGFRAYARFGVFTVFFGLIVVFYLSNNFRLKKNIYLVLLLLQILTYLYFYQHYYPVVKPSIITRKPAIVKFLKNNNYSSYTHSVSQEWRRMFVESGYSQVNEYLKLNSANRPFLNLLYNSRSCGIFASSGYNSLNYSRLVNKLNFYLNQDSFNKLVSPKTKKLARLLGCTHLVTTNKYQNLKQVFWDKDLKVYALGPKQPLARFYSATEQYFDINDLLTNISSNKNIDRIYLNQPALSQFALPKKIRPQILIRQPEYLKVKLDNKAPGYLYFQIRYFPGWQAVINSKKVKLIKANLSFIALKVPKGKNVVELKYHPPFWRLSLFLASVGYLLLATILAVGIFSAKKDT